jgi:hypothetical protein
MATHPTLVLLAAGAVLSLGACADGEPVPEGDTTADAIDRTISEFVPAADQYGLERFKVVYALEGQETGTRTMWVEDHGGRVAIEEDLTIYGEARHQLSLWDGERMHLKSLPDGEVYSTRIRTKVSEPTSFATTAAQDLERVGYRRLGEKTIAGRACQHWKQDQLNFEGCRWERIELEFLNGAGTGRIIQRTTATEVVEGEGIPARFTALVP